ncbi:MAG: DUF2344 domain-containing protein [Clostridia bacterium]|nr:DUF2344 domain-containing protein [Clostridia bacterium]
MIYRLKYEKRDEVKYIGHLDTMRTFTRCIKRTNLPIKFSGGFNPRVQLSFALPLGVGVTSECEYVDLELQDEIALEEKEIIKELNRTLPEGFRVTNVQKIEKSKSLMSLVKEAVYEITLLLGDADTEESCKILDDLFARDELLIEKQTKNKKLEQINLKEMILDVKTEVISYAAIRTTIHCLAGSEKNLNPNLVVELMKNELGEAVEDFEIHRKELIL